MMSEIFSPGDNWIAEYKKNYEKERKEKESGLKGQIKTIVSGMKVLKAKLCEVKFDGCGDSGMVEEVIFTGAKGVNLKADKSLSDLAERFCYDYLDSKGIDWYNNEGGYGELSISSDGSAKLNVSQRFVSTEDYFFEIGTKKKRKAKT